MYQTDSDSDSDASVFGVSSKTSLNRYFTRTLKVNDIVNMHNKQIAKINGTRFRQAVSSEEDSASEFDQANTSSEESIDYAQSSSDEDSYTESESESETESETESESEFEQVRLKKYNIFFFKKYLGTSQEKRTKKPEKTSLINISFFSINEFFLKKRVVGGNEK